jgi:hypothetical protein
MATVGWHLPDDVVSTVRETADWARRAGHSNVESCIMRFIDVIVNECDKGAKLFVRSILAGTVSEMVCQEYRVDEW